MQREGSTVLSQKVHSVKFSLPKLSLQLVSLFLLQSNTFQEQSVVTVRYVPRSETKRHHKEGVTLDEWVAKRVYLVSRKLKKDTYAAAKTCGSRKDGNTDREGEEEEGGGEVEGGKHISCVHHIVVSCLKI